MMLRIYEQFWWYHDYSVHLLVNCNCATLSLQLFQLLALAIHLNCIRNLAPLNQPGADGESDTFEVCLMVFW